jgi:predicted nucleotidyltransferase
MKFGLSEKEFKIVESLIFIPFKNIGIKTWVFGSRARGDFQKFSDLDILYQIPKNSNIPYGFFSGIKSALEDSDLPIKIDLVDIDFLAESYKDNVLNERLNVD